LFHSSNVFGYCIIHILYTGRAKIKKIIPAPKRLNLRCPLRQDFAAEEHQHLTVTTGAGKGVWCLFSYAASW